MNKNKGESKDSPFVFLHVIANQCTHRRGNLRDRMDTIGNQGVAPVKPGMSNGPPDRFTFCHGWFPRLHRTKASPV